ncbi:MAG: pyridoxal-dependent decarboxylase, exosortase A system-associated, partial [Planctomycetes bacterium]|nr:pyridoxal-dependent decarboxylase, exosortase A system-associated [Planctomycetota bacterium]
MDSHALASVLRLFAVAGGELRLSDGRPVTALAAAVPTPFFVYDRAVATARYGRLRAAVGEQVCVHYAVKANPHPELVVHFHALGAGFDVASRRELETVLAAGAPPDRVGFAGPGKSADEIGLAIDRRLGALSIESARELELADRMAAARGTAVNVMLRLNPPFGLRRARMQMGGGASPFGIDAEQIPALLGEMRRRNSVRLKGFHVFAGSQNLDAALLGQFVRATLELLRDLAAAWGAPLDWINLGGGLGIPYHAADRELDVENFGRALARELERHRGWLSETRILLESGRYLVGECGVYVTRVRYLKTSRGRRYAVVDGGLHHHLAATGHLGMVVHRNYPIAVLNRMGEAVRHAYHIAGPLCTPLDVLGEDVALPELEEGDLIGV